MIQKAASQFWRQISALACNSESKFSNDWLDDFKRHHKLKKQKQHEETDSVNLADSEKRMIEMWNIVKKYEMNDMYNMNETALYWKMISDVTLVTEHLSDSKKKKTCISIAVCFNASESHKLHLWMIEKTKNLQCFERNKTKISSLDMI